MDSIPLPPLTLGRYQFELTLEEPARLPAYLGGMLRGGFGVTFKRLVCMQPHLKRCSDCLLLHTCAYPAIFEPAPPPDAEVLSTHERIPVPYVFEPRPRREAAWQAGEPLRFGLGLIGQGITYMPYFVLAFQNLGRQGLGSRRKQAKLTQVVAVEADGNGQAPLWHADRLRHDWATCGQWHAQDIETPDRVTPALTLHFHTPTRLKHRGHYVQETPPFHVVFRTLLRRVSSLSYFYAGQPWDVDYRGWIEQAKQVDVAEAQISWQNWERYSTRQRQRMNLGGVVGSVTYRSDASNGLDMGLSPFLPLLRLGELIHVGKGAVFGNGQYEVIIEA